MLQEPPHILHIIKLKCLHASFMTATLDKLPGLYFIYKTFGEYVNLNRYSHGDHLLGHNSRNCFKYNLQMK